MNLGRWLLAASLGVALSGAARAQNANDNFMPGTPVGTPSVQQVGTQLPAVGGSKLPKAGSSLPGYGNAPAAPPAVAGGVPTVDASLVVAPYPTPNSQSDDFWDRLNKRWLTLFNTPNPPTPTITPGIYRRDRQRAKARDLEEQLRRFRG